MKLSILALLIVSSVASGAEAKKVKIGKAEPRPADVATIDGVLKAYYEVITGPAGPRDWARDATLYRPGTRFTAITIRPDGTLDIREMDHQAYVNWSDPELSKGFLEKEIKREEWRWGTIAQVRSSYETRRTADGPVLNRGVNIIELMNDGKRWWITAAMWQDETKDLKLPAPLAP